MDQPAAAAAAAADVAIPDLRALDPRRKDSRRAALLDRAAKSAAPLLAALRGAAPHAAAAAFLAVGSFAGGLAFERWRAERLDLGGVHSTIRPTVRHDSARLALAAQASRGELAWDGAGEAPAARAAGVEPRSSTTRTDWAAALRFARPVPGERSAARALGPSALAQLRVTDAVSGLAASRVREEDAAAASHDAFAQQLVFDRGGGTTIDSLSAAPKTLSTLPAPDVSAPPRNVTPYQDMLQRAYADAQEAASLRRKAPRSLAVGAALLAAGKAMLGVPGAGLAARGLLAAGAAATARGVRQTKEARLRLARAKQAVKDIRLLQGQKDQAELADACVEALAQGAQLERCRADGPEMTALVRRSVDRELADSPVWEVEGGRRIGALPD